MVPSSLQAQLKACLMTDSPSGCADIIKPMGLLSFVQTLILEQFHLNRKMIKRLKEGKVCQSALRHRVRNLRAKVRLLLPAECCGKERKRAKNVFKMMQDRGPGQQWYLPAASQKRHMFERLSHAQIEQIKEDKLYYVGEQFLDEFDRFLETHHGVKDWKGGRAHTAGTSIHEISFGYTPLFHKNSSSNLSDFHVSVQEKEVEPEKEKRVVATARKTRNLMQQASYQEKRRYMAEQQLTRKTLIKHRIEERQKRREENWGKVIEEKQNRIQQRSKTNLLRTASSFRVKKNREGFGEINNLSEKLRELCLQRSKKQKE